MQRGRQQATRLSDDMREEAARVVGNRIDIFSDPQTACPVSDDPTAEHRITVLALEKRLVGLVNPIGIAVGAIGSEGNVAAGAQDSDVATFARGDRFLDAIAGQRGPTGF